MLEPVNKRRKEVKEAKRVAKEMVRVARTEMQSTDSKEENV